jgi:hypothetical protein
MDTNLRQQPIANERADNANCDIAYESETSALYDFASQPAGNKNASAGSQKCVAERNIQHTATCILEKRKPATDQDDRNTNVIGHVDALPFANKLSLIVARIVLLAVSKTPATVWVLILLFGTPTATTTLLTAVASFAIILVLTTSAALISLLATLILTLILHHHYSLVGISHGDPPARA